MSVYADTSLFVSLYLNDSHTAEAKLLVAEYGNPALTIFHVAEWAHSVEQHVFRKKITLLEARKLEASFEKDRRTGLWQEVEMPQNALPTCTTLARKHVARLGTRTLDSLHVACALELGARLFLTFDKRQLSLARAAGLKAQGHR